MEKTPLRRLGPGVYETLDGRYRIERVQDAITECDHPLCDPLHQKYWTQTGDGRGAIHWMTYVAWCVWDTAADDYAWGHSEFDSKRDAHEWLNRQLASAS